METVLRNLGFTVEKVLNGNLDQMETAILNLKRRLGASRETYGFFFYAGHGVQSGGDNYLIPVTADNIRTETHLRERAVSLQFVLDSLNDAGNELNMIVLDACRDNPFGWARSGTRGLSVVSRAPSGTIVMYAAGAGQQASDGTGRNGLFTSYLLTNLRTPGLSVFEVFDRTMGDVIKNTNGDQHPELSLRFSGAASAFLGSMPAPVAAPAPAPAATPAPAPVATPTPAPAPTVDLNNIISSHAGWIPNKFGANPTVISGSEGTIRFTREIMQNREVDVMTLSATLARGNAAAWRIVTFNLSEPRFVQRFRVANGVRFSVLGDGGAGWRVQVGMADTTADGGHYEIAFNARRGTVTTVDIPYSRLKQPDWAKKVPFDKRDINYIGIYRHSGNDSGLSGESTIKVFNFEFY